MPWYVRAHVRPLLGSAALHLLFLAVIIVAAVNWRSDPPPAPLAIEGNIVRYEDLPRSVRQGKPLAEPAEKAPVTMPEPEPEPAPKPEPEPVAPQPESKPEPDPAEAQRAQEAAAALQRQEAEQKTKAAEALAAQQRADAEAQRKAADEKQKADENAKATAEKAALQQQEKEAASRVAKLKSAREAELRKALALEEEGEAVAQSGVVDEYRALLVQTIERNWNRPPTAKAGLECTLYVTQATGGTVIDVKLGACNGDEAVRESVTNAVYRSSPLPAPRDSRAFQRQLVIVFKPTE